MKRLALLLLLFAPSAFAQVNVAIAPVARQQFFSATGQPLASGCVWTYAAGTSTQQATYTDSSGLYQNTNPIILDAGGFGEIWMTNNAYKIVVYSAGGTNCASGVQQWSQDNVSAYQIINQASNLIIFGATTDPSGSAGELGYRTDIPCLRLFTTVWDCVATLSAIQTFANKTINLNSNTVDCITNTAGNYARNNGTSFVCSPILQTDVAPNETSINLNSNSSALAQYHLVKYDTSSPSLVTQTLATDTSGIIGICEVNCTPSTLTTVVTQGAGISGGTALLCAFDNAGLAGDYFTQSGTVAGDCHDAGATCPGNTQVLGKVNSTTITPNIAVTLLPNLCPSGGESIWSAYLAVVPGTIVATQTILANAHTITRFTYFASIPAVGCSSFPIYGVKDVTTSTVLTTISPTTSSFQDSGAISVATTAGDTLELAVTTLSSGCSTNPQGIALTAVYR